MLEKGQRVELFWDSELKWYSAIVLEVLTDGKLRLEFDEAHGWSPGVFPAKNVRGPCLHDLETGSK